MEIKLYKNKSDSRVMNKDITTEHKISSLKICEPVDVLRPTFIIDAFNGVEDYNYLYFDKFDRYYFCTVVMENHKAFLSCTIDPLMSHADGIKTITTFVDRNEFTFNEYLPDERLPINPRKFITSKQIVSPIGTATYLLLVKG